MSRNHKWSGKSNAKNPRPLNPSSTHDVWNRESKRRLRRLNHQFGAMRCRPYYKLISFLARDSKFDDDPLDVDEQKAPSSFREMMRRLNDIKSNRNPCRHISSIFNFLFWFSRPKFLDEGDTEHMSKKPPDVIPTQGKNETPESYARRLNRCVQDELVKVTIAKRDKVCCPSFWPVSITGSPCWSRSI